MLRFMNELTDVEDWFIKVRTPSNAMWVRAQYSQIKDAKTTEKWIQHAVIASKETQASVPMTLKMATYCIAELKQRAERIKTLNSPPTFVYNGDVYKSDDALSTAFCARLQTAATAFESKVPEDAAHWWHGSNRSTRDIVDPAFFPLLYGRTRVLAGDGFLTLDDCISRCGEGVVIPIPGDDECGQYPKPRPDDWYAEAPFPRFSKRFQCLPCEVDISTGSARWDITFL